MRVLHVSREIPDLFQPRKTRAVLNLIKETKDSFGETLTLSLNRSSRTGYSCVPNPEANITAVRYFGLPYGAFHLSNLRCLHNRLADSMRGWDVIHGHKLTCEGVLCYLAHIESGVRYVVTIRGDTDFKFIHYLPQYRSLFRSVVSRAERIFCLNNWSAAKVKYIYPDASDKIVVLPNICYIERFLRDRRNCVDRGAREELHLVTAFNFDSYKRKGFELLLRSMRRLRVPSSLVVIGDGSRNATRAVNGLVARYALGDRVTFIGFKTHEDMARIYSESDIFVLPSKRETFGMVYLEALFSGVPVLQTCGVGLDGYFRGEPFFMTAGSEGGFVAAIERFYSDRHAIHARLMEYLDSCEWSVFTVKDIVATYASAMHTLSTD